MRGENVRSVRERAYLPGHLHSVALQPIARQRSATARVAARAFEVQRNEDNVNEFDMFNRLIAELKDTSEHNGQLMERLEGLNGELASLRAEITTTKRFLSDAEEKLARPRYDIYLDSVAPTSAGQKIQTIKAVREFANLDLKAAKDLVEGALPARLVSSVNSPTVDQCHKAFAAVGATIRVEPA